MIKQFLKSKKLSDAETNAVALYYEGFSEAQIAKELGVQKVTVIANLGKARRKFGYDNNRRMCYEIRTVINERGV